MPAGRRREPPRVRHEGLFPRGTLSRRLELRVCASFACPPTPAGGNVELAQVLYMQWVFVTNEEHRVQELSLLKGLLAKLPSLYCPGQNTHPSSVPEKDTIFTLPGCLLYKYS